MPVTELPELLWAPEQYSPEQVPEPWCDWLFYSGSLTQRLKRVFNNDLSVQVIKNDTSIPTASEQRFLGGLNQLARIREVLLICEAKPRVFARSVMPLSSLTGSNRELMELGNRPLGEFLFNHPCMKRGPFEVVEFPVELMNNYISNISTSRASSGLVHSDDQDYECQQALGHKVIWGRRSLFYLHENPISVCEVFLPSLEEVSEGQFFTR